MHGGSERVDLAYTDRDGCDWTWSSCFCFCSCFLLLDLITLILLLSMGEVEEWLDLTQTAMDVIGFLLGLHVFVFVFVFRVCCFWFEFSSPTVAVQGTQANFNFD